MPGLVHLKKGKYYMEMVAKWRFSLNKAWSCFTFILIYLYWRGSDLIFLKNTITLVRSTWVAYARGPSPYANSM